MRHLRWLTLRAHFVRPNRLRRFVEPNCPLSRVRILSISLNRNIRSKVLFDSGGEGGIRTLEGVLALTPLAGERFRPLSHLSDLTKLLQKAAFLIMCCQCSDSAYLATVRTADVHLTDGIGQGKAGISA